MKTVVSRTAIVVLFFLSPASAWGQPADCDGVSETTVNRQASGFFLSTTNNNSPLGDGVDEETWWIFDFRDELADLQTANLSSALLTLNITASSDIAGLGTDGVGIAGDAISRIGNFASLPAGVGSTVEFELLDHYPPGDLVALIAAVQMSDSDPVVSVLPGQLLMSYQDDATINSASLELVFEVLSGWDEPSGGDFSNGDNWSGGEIPASDEVAHFKLGSTYAVTFSQSLTNDALVINGDDIIFDLGGTIYTLLGTRCPPAVSLGPAASHLTLTGGALNAFNGVELNGPGAVLHIESDAEVNLTTEQLKVGDGNVLVRGELDTDGYTGVRNGLVSVEDGGYLSSAVLIDGVGAPGTLQVVGTDSEVFAARSSIVGLFGLGVLRVADGALAGFNDVLSVGSEAMSQGQAIVEGVGSRLLVPNERLYLGRAGLGELQVMAGGRVEALRVEAGSFDTGAGQIRVEGAGSVLDVDGALQLGNTDSGIGTLDISNGGQVSTVQLVVGTFGVVTVQGGTCLGAGCPPPPAAAGKLDEQAFALTADSLILASGATFTTDTITFTDGAFLGGSGTFPFAITNTGTVSPGDTTGTAGIFSAGADYAQSENGILEIELGGTGEGDYDRLSVAGTATLAGTLRLLLLESYTPEPGDTFEIVRASALTGGFEEVELPEGLFADVTYTATSAVVTVSALAAPSLTVPEDEEELLPPVALQWQALSGASNYQVQVAEVIDETADFAAPVVDEAGLTTVQLEVSLPGARQYVWRVRGVTSAGEAGLWSEVRRFTTISGVATEEESLPSVYALEGNYPNPFNPTTRIRYALPEASAVRLAVYDALGREVAVLFDGHQGPGRHEAVWQASDMPSGVYLYRLMAGSFVMTRQMTFVK